MEGSINDHQQIIGFVVGFVIGFLPGYYIGRYILAPKIEKAIRKTLDGPGVIYVIAHPETKDVVYVGQTKNLNRRKKEHLRRAGLKVPLYEWMSNVLEEGKEPLFYEVLDGRNKEELNRLEKERISFYVSQGIKLLNMNAGG